MGHSLEGDLFAIGRPQGNARDVRMVRRAHHAAECGQIRNLMFGFPPQDQLFFSGTAQCVARCRVRKRHDPGFDQRQQPGGLINVLYLTAIALFLPFE